MDNITKTLTKVRNDLPAYNKVADDIDKVETEVENIKNSIKGN